MAEITVLFNPRCSKCRQARALLDERGVDYELIEYLRTPPDRTLLEEILEKLGAGDPRAIVRTKEPRYAELGLGEADPDTVLDALVRHPELIERPIAVRGGRAVVARPPERILDLLRGLSQRDPHAG